MAKKFVYKTYKLGAWPLVTPERIRVALTEVCNMFIEAGQGWSLQSPPAGYESGAKAFFAKLVHTGGSKLAIGLQTPQSSNNFGFPENRTAMNRTDANGLWFCYLPPCESDFLGTPKSASFLPIESLPVCSTNKPFFNSKNQMEDRYSIINIAICQESFWYCSRIDAGSSMQIDTFYFFGKIISGLENDTGNTLNRYALLNAEEITNSSNFWSNSNANYHAFFRERDGQGNNFARTKQDGANIYINDFFLNERYHNSGTKNNIRWSPGVFYLNRSDVAINGVVDGDSIRGVIDSDMFKAIKYNQAKEGQLLDGGNMICLGGGLCVGWAASNPALN